MAAKISATYHGVAIRATIFDVYRIELILYDLRIRVALKEQLYLLICEFVSLGSRCDLYISVKSMYWTCTKI